MVKEDETHAVHQPIDSHPSDVIVDVEQHQHQTGDGSRFSRVKAFYSHPWTQIILISLICFCCPGVSGFLSSSDPF